MTKTVIWLDIGEILLMAKVYIVKTPIFERKLMEDSEILLLVKTSSTFGAKCARKWQMFAVFTLWSHDTMYLKIDLIDRWCLKQNFAESNTKIEILGNFTNGSLRSHDLYVTINKNGWWVGSQAKFCWCPLCPCNFWPKWWPCKWPLLKFLKWLELYSLISLTYNEKGKFWEFTVGKQP